MCLPLSPTFILSLVIASINVAIFHLLWGKGLKHLMTLWLAGAVGFVLGEIVAEALGLSILTIGGVHPLEGTVGAWVLLFIAKPRKV